MNKTGFVFFAFCLMSCASNNNIASTDIPKQNIPTTNIPLPLNTDTTNHLPLKTEEKTEGKTVELLNQIFNADASNKNMVLIINNESDCDFTMNILGEKKYSLPVAAKKTGSIVVERGDYEMTSEVCKSNYKVHKKLLENTQVNIKYSIVKT